MVVKSLGRLQYLALLKHAAAMVGNSSSGVVESVPLRLAAVDLGTRQEGRAHAENVLTARFDEREILEKLDIALNDPAFHERIKNLKVAFGDGNCGRRIADILATVPLSWELLAKRYCIAV